MSFLPVVERELRVNARNSRFYWGRFGTALVAIAVIAWLWLINAGGRASSSDMARMGFTALSWLAFGFSAILGLFLTADCISEEKREGTLGLLFLTNLKGYDVTIGKMAAHSFRAIYSLMAIFPVLTIPLLLGGLVGQEIFRVSISLLATLILSLSVGIFVSAISRHDRKAQFGALLLMALITAGVPALLAFLKFEYRMNIDDAPFGLSPAVVFHFAFQKTYLGNETHFWRSISIVHGLSWIAFFAAAAIIRRVWQDRPEAGSRAGWRTRFRDWKRGLPEARRAYRNALLEVNPYYWLTARDRLRRYYVLWFLAGCATLWGILWLYNGRDMFEQEVFFICAIILHTAMKVWLAAEAGRQFSEDRRSSALELTLSTPLPVREILEGQFLGILRQFGIAIAAILLFDITAMVVGARMRVGSDTDAVLMWVAMMIVLIVDAAAIVALGMWLGLIGRRSSRAIAQILFYVIALPWLILIGLLTYLALVRYSGMDTMAFFIGAYFVVSVATDFVIFLKASGNLTGTFREAATQRFDNTK